MLDIIQEEILKKEFTNDTDEDLLELQKQVDYIKKLKGKK